MLKKILTLLSILLFVGCAKLPETELKNKDLTTTISKIETVETNNPITEVKTNEKSISPKNENKEISWTVENEDLRIKVQYEENEKQATVNKKNINIKEDKLKPKLIETKNGTSIVEVKVNTVDKNKLSPMQLEALKMGLSLEKFEQLKKDFAYWEDLKNMIYLDPEGMLVVGPAFSLSTKLNSGKRKLQPLNKINKIFSQAGIHKLSDANYNCMIDMNGSVNYEVRNGTLSRFLNKAEKQYSHGLYKLSDVKEQKSCTDNQYVLSNDEVHALLEYAVIDIYKNVKNSARKQKINLNKLDFEIVEVVIELYYRGGKKLVLGTGTPSINKALRLNDEVAFGKEVYARSNGNKLWQNDLRNAAMMKRVKRALTFSQSQQLDEFIATNPLARKVNKRLLQMFTKQKHFADDETRLFVKKLVAMDHKVGFKVAALF